MQQDQLQIEIKPAEEEQLDFLEKELSPGSYSKYHYRRHAVQKRGEGIYLIAWHHKIPIGHFLLHWSGPKDEYVKQFIPIEKRAYLEAGGTRMDYRKKGVATRLIQEGERLAKEYGCTKIGLEVGSTDNPTARSLYEKLGYKDWEHGEFTIYWEYTDEKGNKGKESEKVIYMDKDL